jgi:hypothetical protein
MSGPSFVVYKVVYAPWEPLNLERGHAESHVTVRPRFV